MKKLSCITLFVALAWVVGGQLPHDMEAQGKGADEPPEAYCADVNNDGVINISDPVHILSFLFLGGPEPTCPSALEDRIAQLEAENQQLAAQVQDLLGQNAALTSEKEELEDTLADCVERCASNGSCGSLTVTGQTRCYDAAGGNTPCTSTAYPGQDGLYQAGCVVENRFEDNGDGTVTDHATGLVWQKATADVNGDGWSNDGDRVNWTQALKYCDSLVFAGQEDWRLPNIKELHSISDYGQPFPSVYTIFSAMSDGYHSSTSWTQDARSTWGCGVGMVQVHAKSNLFFVRAVRTAAEPE